VAILEEERRHLVEGVEAVQRAHREQRALLERLPDMVVIHVHGKIVYANDAFTRTLGWNGPDQILNTPLLDVVAPRSHAAFEGEIASSADARGAPQLTRASLLRRDGTPVLVEIAPPQAVVFDGHDARLIVGRDIEERVRLQEQLATAERLASLGLLAAGVAHEVNNPLAYVLNNIEIARRQLASLGPSAESSLQALTVALEGVDRIRFIVRELLLLSRSEGESVGPVDVREVVESTLSLARPTIARIGTLVTELEDAPPARANVARVAQIVLNLVLNAIEAMQASDTSANVLTVRLKKAPDDQVLLEVQDTGAGIAKHDLDRIFEPFFTTKPPGLGTGLGLSITQRLVVELGGHIDVTSAPRRGSTFRVVLPAAAEVVEQDASSTVEAVPQAAPSLTAAEPDLDVVRELTAPLDELARP
jgi:PAS domain S-box-containing protein